MKKSGITIILLCLFISSYAQNKIVSGTVVNKEKSPISYASIIAYNSNNQYLSGAISDSLGHFQLNCNNVASLVVSHIMYKEKQVDFSLFTSNKEICLDENINTIDAVVVTADLASKSKYDKFTYSFSESLTDSINFAQDLLRMIPSLKINPNRTIAVNGNPNVEIRLNGKKIKDYSIIESLSPDIIQKVEVQTTPDADILLNGYESMINIITKQKKKPSIDIYLNPSFSLPHFVQPSVSLSYFYKKIRLGIKGDYWYRKVDGDNSQTLSYSNTTLSKSATINRVEQDKELWLDFDFFASEKNLINNTTYFSYYNENVKNISRYFSVNAESKKSKSNSLTLANSSYYKFEGVNSSFSALVDLYKYKGNFDDSLTTTYGNAIFNSTNIDKNYVDLKTDYAITKDGWQLKAMYEGQIKNTNIFDQSNKSSQSEYLNTFKTIGYLRFSEKIYVQGSVALASRKLVADNNKETSTNILPVISLNYTNSKNDRLSLLFVSSKENPSLWQMNPILFQSEYSIYTKGNPFLKSSIDNNIRLNYSFKRNSIYNDTKLSTSFVNNKLYSYYYFKNDTIVKTFINHDNTVNIGLVNYFSLSIVKSKVTLYITFKANFVSFDSNKYFSEYSATGVIEYTPKDWNISSVYSYAGKSYTPYSVIQSSPSINFSAYRTYKKVVFGTQIFLPFNKNNQITNSQFPTIHIKESTKMNYWYINLSLRYRFKTGKDIKSIDRDVDFDDDKGR